MINNSITGIPNKKPTMLVKEGINKVKKIIFIRYEGGGGEKFTIISNSRNEHSE